MPLGRWTKKIEMSLLSVLKAAFAAPDPMRFSAHSAPPPNWFGELEGKNKRRRGIDERVVLVNEATGEFEFPDSSPFEGIEIDPKLTEKDAAGLKSHGYNPDNPAYHVAKRYFAKNPGCGKKELAENSAPPFGKPLSAETMKDVLAVFRENVVKK